MSKLNAIRYDLPAMERAFVLAPHPDDETLGCGGTMAHYSGRVDFTVIALSNGEAVNIPAENRADLRRRELMDAVRIIGGRDTVFLDIPDGKFSIHRAEIRERLSELLALKKPQIVFSPSPLDLHEDHRETALVCIELLERLPSTRIAFYEIYNPIRFNTLIDISSELEVKKEALTRYHHSLLGKEDIFITCVLSLNKFRSLFALRDSYYEAFWIPDAVTGLSEAVDWLLWGTPSPAPEDILLSALRVTDTLMHEFEVAEGKLMEKTEAISGLSLELKSKEETIASLEERLRLVETSLSWKLIQGLRRIKGGLFPERTRRKRIYENLVNSWRNKLPR